MRFRQGRYAWRSDILCLHIVLDNNTLAFGINILTNILERARYLPRLRQSLFDSLLFMFSSSRSSTWVTWVVDELIQAS